MVQTGTFGAYKQAVIADGDLECTVTSLGVTVQCLKYQGKEVTLGHETSQAYLDGTCYIGAVIGRVAGRIRNAVMRIDDREYRLAPNENENHLHGGPHAFDKREWEMEVCGESAVRFTLVSPDGDNGYPGNLTARVICTVSENELRMDLEAESDADTVYAPTSHIYFNLGGPGNVLDTLLQIDADGYVELDRENLSTGRIVPCEGNMDFRTMRRIGQNVDHCFVLNGGHALAAQGRDIRLDVYTDYPGIVVYTGEFLADGFAKNAGFAAEPGFFPEAVNYPAFPSPVLRKGEKFHKYIRYVFCHV